MIYVCSLRIVEFLWENIKILFIGVIEIVSIRILFYLEEEAIETDDTWFNKKLLLN